MGSIRKVGISGFNILYPPIGSSPSLNTVWTNHRESLIGAGTQTHCLIPSPSFPAGVTGKALGPHIPSPCPREEWAPSSPGFLQGPTYEKEVKMEVAEKDGYHNVKE